MTNISKITSDRTTVNLILIIVLTGIILSLLWFGIGNLSQTYTIEKTHGSYVEGVYSYSDLSSTEKEVVDTLIDRGEYTLESSDAVASDEYMFSDTSTKIVYKDGAAYQIGLAPWYHLTRGFSVMLSVMGGAIILLSVIVLASRDT